MIYKNAFEPTKPARDRRKPKIRLLSNKKKINNCIAISMFFIEKNKRRVRKAKNFHISEIKLIWLIKQKTLKAILRLWLQLKKLAECKNIEF